MNTRRELKISGVIHNFVDNLHIEGHDLESQFTCKHARSQSNLRTTVYVEIESSKRIISSIVAATIS